MLYKIQNSDHNLAQNKGVILWNFHDPLKLGGKKKKSDEKPSPSKWDTVKK